MIITSADVGTTQSSRGGAPTKFEIGSRPAEDTAEFWAEEMDWADLLVKQIERDIANLQSSLSLTRGYRTRAGIRYRSKKDAEALMERLRMRR